MYYMYDIKEINKTDILNTQLEENQYFASLVKGVEQNYLRAEWNKLSNKERLYKMLCKTSKGEIYLTKNKHQSFCNDYGINCIVTMPHNYKVCILGEEK